MRGGVASPHDKVWLDIVLDGIEHGVESVKGEVTFEVAPGSRCVREISALAGPAADIFRACVRATWYVFGVDVDITYQSHFDWLLSIVNRCILSIDDASLFCFTLEY